MDKIFTPLRTVKQPDDTALKAQIREDLGQIEQLAKAIPSMTAFNELLQGIPDPDLRQQVRTLLLPLVTFPVSEAHGVSRAQSDAAPAGTGSLPATSE